MLPPLVAAAALFGAIPLSSAPLPSPVPAHLVWSSTYGTLNISSDADFINLAMAPTLTNVSTYAAAGIASAFAPFQSGPYRVFVRPSQGVGASSGHLPSSELVPGWRALVDAAAAAMAPAVAAGHVVSVFLGDEVCCHNGTCMNAVLAPVAAKLRTHFPRTSSPEDIFIWTNECGDTVQQLPNRSGAVPPAIDVLSVDVYSGYLPGVPGSEEVVRCFVLGFCHQP
jgi:hypothetical protein